MRRSQAGTTPDMPPLGGRPAQPDFGAADGGGRSEGPQVPGCRRHGEDASVPRRSETKPHRFLVLRCWGGVPRREMGRWPSVARSEGATGHKILSSDRQEEAAEGFAAPWVPRPGIHQPGFESLRCRSSPRDTDRAYFPTDQPLTLPRATLRRSSPWPLLLVKHGLEEPLGSPMLGVE